MPRTPLELLAALPVPADLEALLLPMNCTRDRRRPRAGGRVLVPQHRVLAPAVPETRAQRVDDGVVVRTDPSLRWVNEGRKTMNVEMAGRCTLR